MRDMETNEGIRRARVRKQYKCIILALILTTPSILQGCGQPSEARLRDKEREVAEYLARKYPGEAFSVEATARHWESQAGDVNAGGWAIEVTATTTEGESFTLKEVNASDGNGWHWTDDRAGQDRQANLQGR